MGGPNPAAAAVLGLIPGVGAMYNGQFFKGLIHVVIFAVLVSASGHHGIFGIFIGAWILYQSFEAFHTAKALREGQPLPDPLGLNEVGNWLNLGMRPPHPGQHGPGPVQGNAGAEPAQGTGYPPYPPPAAGAPTQGWGAGQVPGYGPYQAPYTPPGPEVGGPGIPPMPPPPFCWRRREPVGAVILIALGLLFLMGQLDIFSGRLFEFSWPLLLIGLGVWLMIRRFGETQGGSK
jgi:hypothetical protein